MAYADLLAASYRAHAEARIAAFHKALADCRAADADDAIEANNLACAEVAAGTPIDPTAHPESVYALAYAAASRVHQTQSPQ
jgi:hypothetical protein